MEFQVGGLSTADEVFDPCECATQSGTLDPCWLQTEPTSMSTWNGSPPLNSVFSLDTDDIWLTGEFGILRRFDSTGNQWIDQGTLDYQRLGSGAFLDEDVGCVIGTGNQIRRTTDGGQTWTSVWPTSTPPNQGHFGLSLDLGANGYGVASGTDGFVAITTNSGATWTPVTSNDLPSGWPATTFAAHMAPGTSTAYIGGPAGRVARADLAASTVTWTEVTIGTMTTDGEAVRDFAFIDANTGYAVGTGARAYKTTNGGNTWRRLEFVGTPPIFNFNAVATWGDGSKAIVVGDQGLVYQLTTDKLEAVNLGASAVTLHLNDVVALDGGAEFMIVGDLGIALRHDGSTWTQPKTFTNSNLVSASFYASDEGFVFGRSFLVLGYN